MKEIEKTGREHKLLGFEIPKKIKLIENNNFKFF